MPQYSNAKRVLHKYIGKSQTFSDDTIWEELELPAGSTGHVLAKVDLVNKTVQLYGMLQMATLLPSPQLSVLIPKQAGWHFADPNSFMLFLRTSGNIAAISESLVADGDGNLAVKSDLPTNTANCVFSFTKSSINPSDWSETASFKNIDPVTLPITIN